MKENNIIVDNRNYIYGSLTRISDLQIDPTSFNVQPLLRNRDDWETGDYIVGQYLGNNNDNNACEDKIELTTGHLRTLIPGDLVVGALGARKATQEIVGDWHDIGPDGKMQDICDSGLFGIATSRRWDYHSPANYVYQGHVTRKGRKVCMKDFVPQQSISQTTKPPNCPKVLLVGTSMSCGKTITAHNVIRILKEQLGFQRVVGTKVTGAGYLNDILTMAKSGADFVFDFVDGGLPSTCCISEQEYRKQTLPTMFGMMESFHPDCVVAEIGSSPCEPYNGTIFLEEYHPQFVILCASDAYSVVGLQAALQSGNNIDFKPDVVCGIATNTTAGIDLVQKLTGLPALNLTTTADVDKLRTMLKKALL